MSNFCEFVDGDMTEEDRKKIDELLIKIAEENELPEKIGKLESENKRLREALESIKEMSSYLSAGEITIYDLIDIHNICCDALKGGKE